MYIGITTGDCKLSIQPGSTQTEVPIPPSVVGFKVLLPICIANKFENITQFSRSLLPQALKMPIDHLPQPCAFFSVYDGHQARPNDGQDQGLVSHRAEPGATCFDQVRCPRRV